MGSVKAWKLSDSAAPKYPDDFEIAKKAVLQVTDIKNNNNKYYAIELHTATAKGKTTYRVFTHYGRTDDLDTNPDAGQKECRFFDDAGSAQAEYDSIYKQKTSKAKGYKELSLASSKIGSQKARGQSSGEVDAKTLEKMKGDPAVEKPKPKKSELPPSIQDLVKYIYAEATSALTTTVNAKITANGIETPLGVLTVGQIEKGEDVLGDIHKLFTSGKGNKAKFDDLSSEFYTAIPHRIGRTREAAAASTIDTLTEISQKQETLQLMKDMLAVNSSGGGGSVLFDDQVDQQYQALGTTLGYVEPGSPEFKEWAEYVEKSQIKRKDVKVVNLYKVKRAGEWDGFDTKVGNEKMFYHGSRIQNWVGLMTRGILLPKIVVSMGVNRTDAGWLGNGIYFGDAGCTAAFYTTPGKKKTRFMTIARVGMGKPKEFTKITYGLNEPPKGYDSCHGLRHKREAPSQFEDNEYVVYRQNQQRMEYLVEFKTNS